MRPSALPLVLLLAAAPLAAQPAPSPDSTSLSHLFGASIGLPGTGPHSSPLLLTVGMQWTSARPGRPGLDLALSTIPAGFVVGAVPLHGRLGLVLPVEVAPGVLLLPSGGLSAAGVASAYGAGGVLGTNAGMGVAFRRRDGRGVRVGATRHAFPDLRGTFWLVEMGAFRSRRR